MDGRRPHDPGSTSTTLSQAWHEHHRYLLDVAYQMLGSVSDAEGVVQEAFARLVSVDLDRIEDPWAWLVVVVSRLCLDQLRSARSRHETYVGPWLPEPLIPQFGESGDPAERATLDDSVRMALLVVLERLTPAERVAVAERFIAAASGGNLEELMQLLDPDVVGETDTGGITPGPPAADRRPCPRRQVAAPLPRGGPHSPHPDTSSSTSCHCYSPTN